jgi:hypothetical protein
VVAQFSSRRADSAAWARKRLSHWFTLVRNPNQLEYSGVVFRKGAPPSRSQRCSATVSPASVDAHGDHRRATDAQCQCASGILDLHAASNVRADRVQCCAPIQPLRRATPSGNLLQSVNGEFEFAFNDFIDLFLGVEMFVNGGAAFEIVVGKGHAGRMKVASIPSRQTLNDFECARIYEWRRSAPASDSSTAW